MKKALILFFFCLHVSYSRLYSQELLDSNTTNYINNNKFLIQPTRTISFNTAEGSNMDVDVSPDGSTLLFTILGDIYSISSSGGVPKQITRGLAIHRFPVWSPDGRYIAYISDATGISGLHVMDANGNFDRLICEGQKSPYYREFFTAPKWTPEGTYIALEGFMYALAGGKVEIPEKIKQIVGFSNDGKYIFYKPNETGDGWKIIKYNRIDGTESRVFSTTTNRYEQVNARISRDGRWLTYLTGERTTSVDSLMIFDLVNGKESLLKNLNIKYPGGTLSSQYYSFSTDSKQLFFAFKGHINQINIPDGASKIIPFNAKVKVDLGSLNYNEFKVSHDSLPIKYTRCAHRSPDGKHLIFQALNKLYLQQLPHGIPHILVSQDAGQFQPSFSPDGKWVAFVTWKDTQGGFLWRVKTSGGKPIKLTNTSGQYHNPSWSPDGTYIVVSKGSPELGDRDNPDEGQIEVINVHNGHVKVVADSIPIVNSPIFSGNGKEVIYMPKQKLERGPKLVARSLNTGEERVLAVGTNPIDGYLLRQISYSPDGRFLVFQSGETLFLTIAPKLGTPIELNDVAQNVPSFRFTETGYDPHWEEDGKILSWSYGNKYFRINPDRIVQAGVIAVQEGGDSEKHATNVLETKISPDQITQINLLVPRQFAKGTIILKNARIITMHGNEVIENGVVVIEDGKISEVTNSEYFKTAHRGKIFDLKNKTIMPGLIDLHSHMKTPPGVFPQQFWMYLSNLAYGVTTARDPSSSYDHFGHSELLETGKMIGPRLYSVGGAIRPDRYSIATQKEANMIVYNRALMGATVIKQYNQPFRLQRQRLLVASKKAGINMTNEGKGSLLLNIGMIKDGSSGVEHNPEWGEIYSDVVTLFATSGSYLTPTLQVSSSRLPFDQPNFYFRKMFMGTTYTKLSRFTPQDVLFQYSQDIIENKAGVTLNPSFLPEARVDAAIVKKGGRVLLGGHGEDQGIGAHFELWALQMGGLDNLEALRIATINGAEGLGVQKDLGSIEVGKIADLLILDKNPLDDIHNSNSIRYVMKDGILYSGDTLDALWPVKKKLPEWRLLQTK